MSGLIGDLYNNTRALNNHSAVIQTAGKNLANINNPDYTRQRVVQQDQAVGTTSGIPYTTIQQIRDTLLDGQVVRETMNDGSIEARERMLSQLEAALNSTLTRGAAAETLYGAENSASDSGYGIGAELDAFFNVFQEFSADPTDPVVRNAVIQRAESLVEGLQHIDQRLADIDADIADMMTEDTAKADALLERIADLNRQIYETEVNEPGSAVDLRDSRQKALEDLAALIDFEAQGQSDGTVDIFVFDGGGASIQLVDGARKLEDLSFDSAAYDVTVGAPPTVIDIGGGSLHGFRDIHFGALADLSNDYDNLAGQLVESVNAAYNPTGTTGDFFDPAGLTAATIALDPALDATSLKATDTANTGANELAIAVAELADQTFSVGGGDLINGSFKDYAGSAANSVAQELSYAREQAESQELALKMFQDQRAAVSGVSMDEEVTDLIRGQRAFQATARVISVIDEMLNTIVNGLVR